MLLLPSSTSNTWMPFSKCMLKCWISGYDMSPFIRRYAKYLSEKSTAYRFEKTKSLDDDVGTDNTFGGTLLSRKHSHSTTSWLSHSWCFVSLILCNLDLVCAVQFEPLSLSHSLMVITKITRVIIIQMKPKLKMSLLELIQTSIMSSLHTPKTWDILTTFKHSTKLNLYVTPQSNEMVS